MAELPKYFHFHVLTDWLKVELRDVSDHDFAEVVRCHDCLMWKKDTYGGVCDRYGVRTTNDWFCAGGEKREVDDER